MNSRLFNVKILGMKTAFFDCFSGISGDMCLGALINALVSAGVPPGTLRRELKKVPLKGYKISSREVRRAGVRATKVDVKLTASGRPARRRYKDIKGIIEKSALSPAIKKNGTAIFKALFEAEARVHDEPYTKIHLHELGAEDAIVDILGTLICLEKLGIEKVIASPVNLGWGTVRTEHGELPVPAPATVELLSGIPVYSSGHPYELTTPTGAAILSTIASDWGGMPSMALEASGTGAGGHNIKEMPNVLRIFIGKTISHEDEISIIETNIDDMDPRICEHVMDMLLKAGALDVYITNILMKKSRPAVKLTVLFTEERRRALSDIILRETTTLGVRHGRMGRSVLAREIVKVKTKFGTVRVKVARFGDVVKNMPEYEDLKRAARRHGATVSAVSAEVLRKVEE
jgi:uncharacterized protein (TIGR00299 family) protein